MKVEVMAAGWAVLEQRCNGYQSRKKNHSQACSLFSVPCSLLFHGANRSVCRV